MRHLKKFENFSDEEFIVPEKVVDNKVDNEEECTNCNCKPCECEEEEETTHGDENVETVQMTENKLYTFSAFNEKKKELTPAQEKFFGKKADKKDDKKAPAKKDEKSDAKGKTPKTKKEKEFAALAEPKDKITFADKIAGAKKKKESK
jgi:hypothetical protein